MLHLLLLQCVFRRRLLPLHASVVLLNGRIARALDVDFLVSRGDINALLLGDDLFANTNLPSLNGLLVHLQLLLTQLEASRLICVSPGLSACAGDTTTGTVPSVLGQQSRGLLHAASAGHRHDAATCLILALV